MMKKIIVPFWLLFTINCVYAQPQDSKQLYETAKTFMKQRDFPNASIVLNRALQLDPQNLDIAKDLSLSYYFQKDNNRALETIKPVLEREDADDQSFEIASEIYRAMNLPKDCEKVIKKGLKKFPNSGPLYNDFGELLQDEGNPESIRQWEKGIEADPSFSKNYYNAAKFYFLTMDKVWSIVYAEVFINMEPSGNKTPEVKELLLESYKKLFSDNDLTKNNNKDKNNFAKAFLESMNKQVSLTYQGINTESLTMIRTRFILEWANNGKYPYQLFDYHRHLLQEGMFEAYNQWLFGPAQNLAAFQNWITVHNNEYNAFTGFQKGRVFKIPSGQYYH